MTFRGKHIIIAKRFIYVAVACFAVAAFCWIEGGTGGGPVYSLAAAFSLIIGVICTAAIFTADLEQATKLQADDEWMSIK
jgi:hypothetical protein